MHYVFLYSTLKSTISKEREKEEENFFDFQLVICCPIFCFEKQQLFLFVLNIQQKQQQQQQQKVASKQTEI